MKKIITLLALISTLSTFAQVPQGVSYQAIALNGSGNPVVNSNVGIRISVVDNTTTGTVLYTETHTKTTNPQGLFNLVIGQGTPTTGTFSAIDWRVNSKFLKVEMDAAGGTNYVLVGTTQLLSAPYALAADSLVTSAGEGITLVSPNGTPYQLTVNDAGQLSLPTSGATSSIPSSFYLYGSFNSFNPTNALLMQPITTGACGSSTFSTYKYFTSGTQLKLLSANNSSSPVYGTNATNNVIPNGSALNIPSDGFYLVNVFSYQSPTTLSSYSFTATSIEVEVYMYNGTGTASGATYSVANNKFSINLTGLTTGSNFYFKLKTCGNSSPLLFGDNLADGTIESGGSIITIPGLTSTPKNYRIDLTLNNNGSGTYTYTLLP
ncbi:MAG: hypothetical protein J0L86_07910 [Flavobacteriales bacterium]|nr:hypothetical protein [Flavobacteriales bacterium]